MFFSTICINSRFLKTFISYTFFNLFIFISVNEPPRLIAAFDIKISISNCFICSISLLFSKSSFITFIFFSCLYLFDSISFCFLVCTPTYIIYLFFIFFITFFAIPLVAPVYSIVFIFHPFYYLLICLLYFFFMIKYLR